MSQFTVYLDRLRKQIEKTPAAPYLILLEDKVGIGFEYFVVAGVLLGTILLFLRIGAGFICNMVGFAYPLYGSLQSIETAGSKDDKQWLMYWVVFGLFGCIEAFVGILTYWIPFYYPLKVSFLLWCMLPQFLGATFLYDNFIRDFMKSQEDKIDAAMSKINEHASQFATTAAAAAVSAATSASPTLPSS